MGYRSEVAIRCQKNAFEMLKKAYGTFNPDKLLNKGDNDYLLYWDWVKWYDEYSHVAAITDVMGELDVMFGGDNEEIVEHYYGYKFMRLGADDDDVEVRSNCNDIELCMIRKIDLSDFENKEDDEDDDEG